MYIMDNIKMDKKIEAYCVKCREKVEMKDPETTTTTKGQPMAKGKCAVCGTTVCKMLKKN